MHENKRICSYSKFNVNLFGNVIIFNGVIIGILQQLVYEDFFTTCSQLGF